MIVFLLSLFFVLAILKLCFFSAGQINCHVGLTFPDDLQNDGDYIIFVRFSIFVVVLFNFLCLMCLLTASKDVSTNYIFLLLTK